MLITIPDALMLHLCPNRTLWKTFLKFLLPHNGNLTVFIYLFMEHNNVTTVPGWVQISKSNIKGAWFQIHDSWIYTFSQAKMIFNICTVILTFSAVSESVSRTIFENFGVQKKYGIFKFCIWVGFFVGRYWKPLNTNLSNSFKTSF